MRLADSGSTRSIGCRPWPGRSPAAICTRAACANGGCCGAIVSFWWSCSNFRVSDATDDRTEISAVGACSHLLQSIAQCLTQQCRRVAFEERLRRIDIEPEDLHALLVF